MYELEIGMMLNGNDQKLSYAAGPGSNFER